MSLKSSAYNPLKKRVQLTGNPDIAKHAEGFRFGEPGGAKPADAARLAKPWSIRNQKRYLAAKELDEGEKVGSLIGKKATVATRIAAKALDKALEGDLRAIEHVTEQIDGKLIQPTLNADLNAIQTMSEDDLRELINQLDAATGESAGPYGVAPEAGEAPADTGNADRSRAETPAQLEPAPAPEPTMEQTQ